MKQSVVKYSHVLASPILKKIILMKRKGYITYCSSESNVELAEIFFWLLSSIHKTSFTPFHPPIFRPTQLSIAMFNEIVKQIFSKLIHNFTNFLNYPNIDITLLNWTPLKFNFDAISILSLENQASFGLVIFIFTYTFNFACFIHTNFKTFKFYNFQTSRFLKLFNFKDF